MKAAVAVLPTVLLGVPLALLLERLLGLLYLLLPLFRQELHSDWVVFYVDIPDKILFTCISLSQKPQSSEFGTWFKNENGSVQYYNMYNIKQSCSILLCLCVYIIERPS